MWSLCLLTAPPFHYIAKKQKRNYSLSVAILLSKKLNTRAGPECELIDLTLIIIKSSCSILKLLVILHLMVQKVLQAVNFKLIVSKKVFFTTLNLWPSRWSSFGIYFCHYLFQTYCDVIVMLEWIAVVKTRVSIVPISFVIFFSCLIKGQGILKKVLLAVNLTLLAARAVCRWSCCRDGRLPLCLVSQVQYCLLHLLSTGLKYKKLKLF